MLVSMNHELFGNKEFDSLRRMSLGSGAVYLGNYLVQDAVAVMQAVDSVVAESPFRHLTTRGGHTMSVAMSNCGTLGWMSDRAGYRYQALDPLTGKPWPAMPSVLLALAQRAAADAGYQNFLPDVCLINRYESGARMGLHQDRDENNLTAPIVSFSLGLPATFIWGGMERSGKTQRFRLNHGDAVVWGGEDRLRFHGVAPLAAGLHELTGCYRINITFRQTGL